MEFNKPVSNPLLVGSIELLKMDHSLEHKGMFINEVLNAEFMCPILPDIKPEYDENGVLRLNRECNIQFPMVSAGEGQRFFMAFTDKLEFSKWREGQEKYWVAMKYDEYVAMLLQRDKDGNFGPARGFVINPFGCNMVVDRDMIINLLVRKSPPTAPGN